MRSQKESSENVWLWKSQARLKFLTVIPAFQKDVRKIRAEFGIPSGGERSRILNIEDFKSTKPDTVLVGRTAEERKGIINAIRDKRAKERADLAERVTKLAKKYHVPENFHRALERYIRRGVIGGPPGNWELEVQIAPDQRRLLWGSVYDPEKPMPVEARWVNLKIYAPLREDELKAAIRELKNTQRRWFSKGAISLKARVEFMRDIEIFELWLEQDGVDKESRMTSEEIGETREPPISGEAVRQIVKNMKKLAKEAFGIERL